MTTPTALRPGGARRTTALDARYGRTPERRRHSLLVGGAVAALVAALVVAWALWTGVGGTTSTLQISTTGVVFQGDTAVAVRWEVDGRGTVPLLCAIEAQAQDGTVVGLKEVAVPVTGSATRGDTTVVRIVRPAATGLIASCRDA